MLTINIFFFMLLWCSKRAATDPPLTVLPAIKLLPRADLIPPILTSKQKPNECENEELTITSDKLKTKVPDSVYNKLKEAGMDDVKTLIFTEMKDLDELCKEL
eukprot:236668_1